MKKSKDKNEPDEKPKEDLPSLSIESTIRNLNDQGYTSNEIVDIVIHQSEEADSSEDEKKG